MKYRRLIRLLGITLPIGFLAAVATAQTASLKGASAVVEEFRKAASAATPVKALRQEAESYALRASLLPPERAAHEWLGLLDRYRKLSPAERRDDVKPETFGITELLSFLPPPEAWSFLAEGAEARNHGESFDLGLLTLTDVLNGRLDKVGPRLEKLRALAKRTQVIYGAFYIDRATSILAESVSDPDEAVRLFKDLIAANRRVPGKEDRSLSIPDLYWLGPQRLEPLLREAMLTCQVSRYPAEAPARDLARNIARANASRLQNPPWGLIDSLENADLHRLFRSPSTGEAPFVASTANALYATRLLQAGQVQQATKILVSSGLWGADVTDIIARVPSEQVVRLAAELRKDALASKTRTASWDFYREICFQLNRAGDAVTLGNQLLTRWRLDTKARAVLEVEVATAYLAQDDVPHGIEHLRRARALTEGDPFNQSELAPRLARIGRLTAQPKVSKAAFQQTITPNNGAAAIQLVEEAEKQGRSDIAQKFLVALLEGGGPGDEAFGENKDYAADLAALYGRLGRHADVLKFLESYDGWHATDLAAVYRSGQPPLGYTAAAAVAATGSPQKALDILELVLHDYPSYSPAYKLLLKIKGNAALPALENLHRRTPFIPAPLIWEAKLLLEGGNLAEAERTARAAVSLCLPKVGMRHGSDATREAYATLTEICKAQGDLVDEARCRSIVRALQLDDKAKDLAEAGLQARAAKALAESEKMLHAACEAEATVAEQLLKEGNRRAAAEYLRRACVTRPNRPSLVSYSGAGLLGSWIVIDSFETNVAASSAFLNLAAQIPDDAPVQYLRGFILQTQDHPEEAKECYELAVKADPGFLPAWKKLNVLRLQFPVSRQRQTEIAEKILALDPWGMDDYEGLPSLDARWVYRLIASKSGISPRPATLWPLSPKQRPASPLGRDGFSAYESGGYRAGAYGYDLESPSAYVARLPLVSAMASIMESSLPTAASTSP